MKTDRVLVSLSMFLLISCGALNREINNSALIYAILVSPDSCDLHLLSDIGIYRKDSFTFPTGKWALEKTYSNSKGCPIGFDSISITSFENDSANVYMKKHFADIKNKTIVFSKYYRLKFKSDSVLNVFPFIKTAKN